MRSPSPHSPLAFFSSQWFLFIKSCTEEQVAITGNRPRDASFLVWAGVTEKQRIIKEKLPLCWRIRSKQHHNEESKYTFSTNRLKTKHDGDICPFEFIGMWWTFLQCMGASSGPNAHTRLTTGSIENSTVKLIDVQMRRQLHFQNADGAARQVQATRIS